MTNNFYKICAANGAWFYKNEILEHTGLVNHAFSTRIGGVSEGAYSSLNLGVNSKDEKQNVLSNFQLFSEAIGIQTEKMVLSNQVHDDKIRIVTKADCGKGVLLDLDIKGIDALITAESGVALATFYADCTPVLIVDLQKKVIASVHSGWRGTLLNCAKDRFKNDQRIRVRPERYGLRHWPVD
jgi:copper oxidase (laccase) domain-containing protein